MFRVRFATPSLPTIYPPSNGVKGPDGFEPQRGGLRDCLIATVSTVANVQYEYFAELLGIPIDSATLLPVLPDPKGLSVFDLTHALFRLGWAATLLISEEHPN